MEHAISWFVWYVQLTITIEASPFIKLSVAIVALVKILCENHEKEGRGSMSKRKCKLWTGGEKGFEGKWDAGIWVRVFLGL